MYFYTLEIMWCFFVCWRGFFTFITIVLKVVVRYEKYHKV